MTRRTDAERLKELEKKIEQIKAKKLQVEKRLKEKERKERTRRLIQVGAIFEKYFEIDNVDQAEKIAATLAKYVKSNKEKIMAIDLDKPSKKTEMVHKER